MRCGYLQLSPEYFQQVAHVSQRVLDWAGGDAGYVETSTLHPIVSFLIPETIMTEDKGPLYLIEGGDDVIDDYLSGYLRARRVGNGEVASLTDPAQVPTITSLTVDDTGSTVTMDWAGPPGYIFVDWGDGTRNYASSHTYQRTGLSRIVCRAAGQTLPASEAWVYVNGVCDPSASPEPITYTLTGASPAITACADNIPFSFTGTGFQTFGLSAIWFVEGRMRPRRTSQLPILGVAGVSSQAQSFTVLSETSATGTATLSPGEYTVVGVFDQSTTGPVLLCCVTITDRVAPAPAITAVTPRQGYQGEDLDTVVTGTNLDAWEIISVSLRRENVSYFGSGEVVGDEIHINFPMLPGPPGLWELAIELDCRREPLTAAFMITDPPPIITSFTPTCATGWSAFQMTVTGTNLLGITQAYLGTPSDDAFGDVRSNTATSVLLQFGEIEHNGPGDWFAALTLVNAFGTAVSTQELRMVPPGHTC